jgi:predicted dehydrogenase
MAGVTARAEMSNHAQGAQRSMKTPQIKPPAHSEPGTEVTGSNARNDAEIRTHSLPFGAPFELHAESAVCGCFQGSLGRYERLRATRELVGIDLMPIKRRDFLTAAAITGSAQLIGTSRAWANANDRIRVAILGMGGRSRDHIKQMARIPGVELATFCDADENQMAQKATDFASSIGKKPVLQQDLRRVLEDKNIDAVTIATCNHWHALAAIWAAQAGKHVYVEKPVCHDFFSGAQMVAASRKYDRLMQGGTQRRSSGYVRRAIQALREGVIGDVYMARCVHYQKRDSLGFENKENPPNSLNWDLWVGPAPMRPFNPALHPYNWHWFWDFGNGELGNNGVHFIDIARWGLNKDLPSKIYSSGGRFGYKDQGQTPNTQLTTYRFDDGTEMVVEIRGRYTNSDGELTGGVIFYGSKGYIISDHNHDKFKVFLEGRSTPEPDASNMDELASTSEREATYAHFQNFFEAVRAGKRSILTADIQETYRSTAFCLMGNISYRLQRELHFDPSAQRFINDQEANNMLRGEYRAPFSIPDKV